MVFLSSMLILGTGNNTVSFYNPLETLIWTYPLSQVQLAYNRSTYGNMSLSGNTFFWWSSGLHANEYIFLNNSGATYNYTAVL